MTVERILYPCYATRNMQILGILMICMHSIDTRHLIAAPSSPSLTLTHTQTMRTAPFGLKDFKEALLEFAMHVAKTINHCINIIRYTRHHTYGNMCLCSLCGLLRLCGALEFTEQIGYESN